MADEFHMWRELAQAGVYDRKMGDKDQEASELHTELSCCKEELTRCQSDLAQATSETQLSHTAKNELTAELHALQERVHLIEEQNSFLVRSLRQEMDSLDGSLTASKQAILMKDQSIKTLVDEMKVMKSVVDAQQKEIEMLRSVSQQANMEKEKCLKELMFEKKMTAELDDLRPRMVSMQGQQEILVKSLGEAETSLAQAKLDNTEKRKLIKELTFELNVILGEAETSLVDSRQTVLMKENCITALMVEKEPIYEKKMTVELELDALRERMVLMQGSVSNL